ncbi:MAG: NifB/NifX family molybdenum-iron cluster-binding protein [Fibrobacteria bacterium]|nr:NifB/NifX family molybdenum-iron cluster-binding protein [Fibrobacteria bacterium]
MQKAKIAVPSKGIGGLEGIRSNHFGHCDSFTLVDVADGEIKNVSILGNKEHAQGGCLVPVNLLAQENVTAIIVGGIGLRPLSAFNEVGIGVYFNNTSAEIGIVVDAFIEGKLPLIEQNQVCQGSGNCRH